MSTIKRQLSGIKWFFAVGLAGLFSFLNLTPPAWAQEAASQRSIQALNQKIDILIDALSKSGGLQFTESMKEELCRLSREVSTNAPQALICGAPHQALIRSPDAPQQALIRSPDAPQQGLLRSPDAPQQPLIRGGNS